MSVGIKAWDEAGNLILDYTDRISKVFKTGFITFNSPNQTISVSVPEMADTDDWAVLIPNGHYVRINNGSFTAIASNSWTDPGASVPYTVIKR